MNNEPPPHLNTIGPVELSLSSSRQSRARWSFISIRCTLRMCAMSQHGGQIYIPEKGTEADKQHSKRFRHVSEIEPV
jgi:hypothetical protein